MENKDCFAYIVKNGHAGCKALKELYCKNEKCNFYKKRSQINMNQIEEDIKKYAGYSKKE